ncbi:MAG: hypothetical protein ACO3LT_06640 [Ilumatobacteraceae bacterium]
MALMVCYGVDHLFGEHLDSAVFALYLGYTDSHFAHLHLFLDVALLAFVQFNGDPLDVALHSTVKLDDRKG